MEYTHADVIDQPIAVVKGSTVLPYTSWRGVIDKAVFPAGDMMSLYLPGSTATAYMYSGPGLASGPPNWFGSLTELQTDASGFQYRPPITSRYTPKSITTQSIS